MASKTKTNSKTVFVFLRACTCVLKHPRHFRDLRFSNGGLRTCLFWCLKGWDLVDEYRCIRRTCSFHYHATFQAVRSLCNADKLHIYHNTRPHTPDLWQIIYTLLSQQWSVNNLLKSPTISRNSTILPVTLNKFLLYFLIVARRIQEHYLKIKRKWFPLNPFSQTTKMSYIHFIRN